MTTLVSAARHLDVGCPSSVFGSVGTVMAGSKWTLGSGRREGYLFGVELGKSLCASERLLVGAIQGVSPSINTRGTENDLERG